MLADDKVWQGNVDAGGFNLSNVGSLSGSGSLTMAGQPRCYVVRTTAQVSVSELTPV